MRRSAAAALVYQVRRAIQIPAKRSTPDTGSTGGSSY